ncbi:hypothetical protein BDQ17DRAFT_1539737 [Cyathus striatus]|nr:hypothetical protein BDQ17DRAFT_1539737 [Cyathus striatus]
MRANPTADKRLIARFRALHSHRYCSFLPDNMPVSGSVIVTLVTFVLSIILIICPLSFRVPIKGFKKPISIGLATAPILAIVILWATKCLGMTEIRLGIVGTDGIRPYNILILFFSLAYMAIALDITGVLQAAAFWVSNKGGSSGWKLFIYFYIMLTVLTQGLNSTAWLIAEFAAANTASMVLFIGNPTNVIISEGFRINNFGFTAYTILPFLGCSIMCFGAIALQFRSQKFIPRYLEFTEPLDVRAALVDPIGACVASVLLGLCVVVIITTSFFHVDVWKVCLPFAVAKFMFDIAWDHYRYKIGRTPGVDPSVEMGFLAFRDMIHYPTAEGSDAITEEPTVMSGDINSPKNINREVQYSPTPHRITITSSDMGCSNNIQEKLANLRKNFPNHFPTVYTAFSRLPYGLILSSFTLFILLETLTRQGWIDIFSRWLVIASGREMFRTIWLVRVFGITGTNIGATILLTKVVRASNMPDHTTRAAAIALAVASNIGAVGFIASASRAGLLWQHILDQKRIHISQRQFAMYNILPLLVMTTVGLGIVSAEMVVLYRGEI